MKKRYSGFVDFHSHVLPGADHGSDCVETSMSQLALLGEAGAEYVVASPHFYPNIENVESFLDRRDSCTTNLIEAASKCKLNLPADKRIPRVAFGAEVLVCPEIDKMPEIDKLCISGTNVILLEMPSSTWSDKLIETVCAICAGECAPVLAHPARYSDKNLSCLFEACDIPLQLNAFESVGYFSRGRAKKWISDGRVTAVGSDIHGADAKRARCLAKFFSLFGNDVSAKMRMLLKDAEFLNIQSLEVK